MHQRFLFITAVIDCGTLHWEYQVEGLSAQRLNHDEDVAHWTDADVIQVTMAMLDVPEDQRSLIKVEVW